MLPRLLAFFSGLVLRLLGARQLHMDLPQGPVRLRYYRLGPAGGEPWILLHGLGSVAASWSNILRALRRECRIVIPELSALGGTESPGGGLGIASGARAVAALAEHEFGARKVTLMGLSLGGWIAVRTALAYPERIGRLLLVDAGGYRNQDWDRIQQLVSVDDLAGVERLYRAFFVRLPRFLLPNRRAFLKAYTSPGVRKVLSRTTEDDAFDDADLARLTLPTGILWGECDGLFRVEGARAMAAALPNAQLQVLPGCGHVLHWDCRRELVAAMQRFRRWAPPPQTS